MEDLKELIAQVEGSSSPSASQRQLMLRGLRQQRLHRPDLAVKHGPPLLRRGAASSLGDEAWAVHEQVALAALELHRPEVAGPSVAALLDRFGVESTRVRKLVGMSSEAVGDFNAANALYDEVLAENPANLLVRKRKVAVLRAQGQLAAAVKELNALLDIFQGDLGSWQELLDLHEKIGNLDAAAFCLEELVLLQPASAVYHTRLAETYAALKAPRLVDARRHCAQALSIAPRYARALHCLVHVCVAIVDKAGSGSKGTTPEDLEVNAAMWEYAKDEMTALYAGGPLEAAVGAMLARQEDAFAAPPQH
mmetsp:Transcript_28637/g.91771  ORF Transcript_28637/g.91771 Transcript_28637/m.91771 type:complete len:308 (-) Transcript_28637:182-1105(-)|eukprot:CAMPEP_0118872390 /NCGR_PEP_ID=MMETSP1163-20130328/14594_1 /TAXON_ID=124430 /ORGANISM="Phaeomonas parva, Strain CCMP2877" /LENGTH=307 /DNA_ID=CAMNT_0006807569 /DNA_START=35 /DNA_END=961 /DNA_ORIENTATION=-